VGQLEEASEEDLVKLGTKRGYVHSWGHKARYVGDEVLPKTRNLIGGQKEERTDSINVNYGRDFECDLIADIAVARDGDMSEEGKKLMEKRGIEVGNIFQLGYHYSKLMKGAEYTAADGRKKPYYMGCYGIGVGRTMAAIVEQYHDQKGIVWPSSVAPYQVHLIALNAQDSMLRRAGEIYDKLTKAGVEVLYDDTDRPAGQKFADADLIGIPVRLVVSDKTGDKIEWKERASDKTQLLSLDEMMMLSGLVV
jgi:prolyl-tRNA synthetase